VWETSPYTQKMLLCVATVAERDQIVEREGVAAVDERRDVMHLEPVGCAAGDALVSVPSAYQPSNAPPSW
jgi:hypothetical protein